MCLPPLRTQSLHWQNEKLLRGLRDIGLLSYAYYYVNFVISMELSDAVSCCPFLKDNFALRHAIRDQFPVPLFGIRSCPLLLKYYMQGKLILATRFVHCKGLSASRSVRFGRLHCIHIYNFTKWKFNQGINNW